MKKILVKMVYGSTADLENCITCGDFDYNPNSKPSLKHLHANICNCCLNNVYLQTQGTHFVFMLTQNNSILKLFTIDIKSNMPVLDDDDLWDFIIKKLYQGGLNYEERN